MELPHVVPAGVLSCLRKTFGALALLGCLVAGALPLGQIPRLTGPCGRVLCECPTVTVSCQGPSGEIIQREEAPAVWTLTTVQSSKAVEHTLFVVVVSDFTSPAQMCPLENASLAASVSIPAGSFGAPPSALRDIPTPPPRLG